MNTQLVPGSEEIYEISLNDIKLIVKKQAPYFSDALINNIATAIYNQDEKILYFGWSWRRLSPAGFIRTVKSAVNAVGTVLNSTTEFVKNISFKNWSSPDKWRADPVKAAGKELKKGLNELGEVLDVPDYLDEVIGYVGIGLAGTAGFLIGGPAGAYAAGEIVAVSGLIAGQVQLVDAAGEALKNLSEDVEEITDATVNAVTSLGDELKDKDLNVNQIIDNANKFEDKIKDTVDNMTIFNQTAKNDLKNFIENEANISRLTGGLPMDISGLLTAINTAPADLQDKLSKGLKEINARAESAMRMAKGVETLQNNFLKISKEAKDLYQDKIKLLDTLKTDGATNKFNLDEIRLSDYKNAKKMRVYQQLLTDKNQILKRLTSDVTNVNRYIADKTTLSEDEINEFKERIEYLEGELDYLLEINNANIGI